MRIISHRETSMPHFLAAVCQRGTMQSIWFAFSDCISLLASAELAILVYILGRPDIARTRACASIYRGSRLPRGRIMRIYLIKQAERVLQSDTRS